jgi:plastocyanin
LTQAAANKRTFAFVPRTRGLKAGQTITYFCRIHPFMRGAVKIVK